MEQGDKDATIRCFQNLTTSKVKSWMKCTEKMLVKLNDLNNDNPSDVWSKEITTKIKSVCKSTMFFAAQAKDNSFSGTLHCEACLVSSV